MFCKGSLVILLTNRINKLIKLRNKSRKYKIQALKIKNKKIKGK